jgi:L-rhamnose-H+ transport protein
MNANPILGVIFHWLGGLASGSFYVPYRGVKKWAWEVYWLVGGCFSWIVCPWLAAALLTQDLAGVLRQQSWSTLFWAYFFGAMWGLGGLTFGLTMRYLGMSLGMGVAIGYISALGTLVPPLAKSLFPAVPVQLSFGDIIGSAPGLITLGGVGVCLFGIFIAALAGLTKEGEMSEAEKKKAIAEFSFTKGMLVATFSGILSSCFNFGLIAGSPMNEATLRAGTTQLWSGLPKLTVVLLGGFTTNVIWCIILNIRNRTGLQYFSSVRKSEPAAPDRGPVLENPIDAPSEEVVKMGATHSSMTSPKSFAVPLASNYLFSALAGTSWYMQFFFYTMGETQMGKFGFASWSLHMASIIIFSTLWGFYFHEWKGSSKKAHTLISTGIATLVISTIIIGVGTWLRGRLSSGN